MAELRQGQQTSAIYWLVNGDGFKVVFNDPSDPDYVGPISGDQGVTGLDSPDVREAAVNITEGHGGLHGNFWSDRRAVTLQTQITGQQASTIDTRESILGAINLASTAYSSDCALIWFPGDPAVVSTTRMNIILDPSFEYDVVGLAPGKVQATETGYGFITNLPWLDGSDAQWTTRTFAVDSAHAFTNKDGSNSLRLKGTKDATATARTLMATTGNFFGVLLTTGAGGTGTITPGRAYSARARIDIADAAATGGPGARMDIDWYDWNGNNISTASSNTIAVATTGPQTLTITNAIAPTNAYSAVVSIRAGSTTSGDVVDIYIDAVQMVAEGSVGAYLDGDSTNASWLGLVGFSQSVNRPNGRFITARRQQPTRISGVGYTKDVLVSLIAADPRIYSTEMYRQQFPHNTNINVENHGSVEAPAIFRVYGPYAAGNLTITNLTQLTTTTLKWDASSVGVGNTANHFVQADEFFRSLLLDPTTYPGSGTSKYGAIDFAATTWPTIIPGAVNPIKFVASGGGTTAATIMDVRWRDAWL